MIQELHKLLVLSFTTSSNEQIRFVTHTLDSLSLTNGYIPALLQIIADYRMDENTTCAALAQLKNCVRRYWQEHRYGGHNELDQNDRQQLLTNIFDLNIALSDNYKFGKIIKDIIGFISQDLFSLAPKLIELIKVGKELRTCLNFLLGMVGYFQYVTGREEQPIKKLVDEVVPELTNKIIQGQESLNFAHQILVQDSAQSNIKNYLSQANFFQEVLYLCTKFMCKSLKWIENSNRRLYSFQWAGICLNRLKIYKQNVLYQKQSNEVQLFTKGSQEFNYFHGRKWSIKYVSKFMQKILIYKQSNKQITQLTKQFYISYWSTITNVTIQMFHHNSSKKNKLTEFSLLSTIFRLKPKLMSEWFDCYMFKIIPSYIYFEDYDLHLALQNPIQFLIYEDETVQSDNLRKVAADLWIKLLRDSQYNFNQQQIMERYKKCFVFMFQSVQSTQIRTKMVGAYLFQKICSSLGKSNYLQVLLGEVSQICNTVIVDLIHHKFFLFALKAIQIFRKCNTMIKEQAKSLVGEFIFNFLLKIESTKIEGFQLLKIEALVGMGSLKSQWFESLTESQLFSLLNTFLEMMIIYQLQEIMSSFKIFIYQVGNRIRGYAVNIIRYLGCRFREISKVSYNQRRNSQFFININRMGVASGIIGTFTLLCFLLEQNSLEIKQALEFQLVNLLQEYFTCDPYEENAIFEQYEDIFDFFHHFLDQIKIKNLELSPKLWFHYMILTFKLSGLPYEALSDIEALNLEQKDKMVLISCYQREQYLFTHYLKLLKSYLRLIPKGGVLRNLKQIYKNFFSLTFLQQMFLATLLLYKKKDEKQSSEYIEIDCKGKIVSTVLLTFMMEQHSQSLSLQAYRYIWGIIIKNNAKGPLLPHIQRYNFQLLYMWIWSQGQNCISRFNQDDNSKIAGYIFKVIKEFNIDAGKLSTNFEEIRRAILGLSTILNLTVVIPIYRNHASIVLKWLFDFQIRLLKLQGYLFDNDFQQDLGEQANTSSQKETFKSIKPMNAFTQDSRRIDEDQKEPNFVIQFRSSSFRMTDVETDELQSNLKQFSDPQNIYDIEYVSILDTITQSHFVFEALLNFKVNCPSEYGQIITGKLKWELQSILNALNLIKKEPFNRLLQRHSDS